MKKWLPPLLLFLLSTAIYMPSLHVPFIFDDNAKIVSNPDIKKLGNIRTKLVYRYGAKYYNPDRNDPSRPLTFLTFMLNYRLGRLNPSGYHVFNLLLHAFNAVLFFFFAGKIFSRVSGRTGTALPFFAAALFAAHPVNVSSVAYVSGRSDLLAAFFYLLALIFFILAFEKDRRFYILVPVCFLFSVSSKQSAVTLPAAILILDYAVLGGDGTEAVLRKKYYHLALWLMLAAYLLFRHFYFGSLGDMEGAGAVWDRYPYLLIQPYVLLRYLLFLAIPAGFCHYHYLNYPSGLLDPKVIFPLLLILLLLSGLYRIRGKKDDASRIVFFSALWFFVVLSPTSSFFPTTTALVENRLYLSGLGFYLVLLLAYSRLFKKNGTGTALAVIAGIHVIIFSGLTVKRNLFYQDPVKLWNEAISMYPGNIRAYNNLGNLYHERGDYEKAEKVFETVLNMRPEYVEARNSLANVYFDERKYDSALAEYRKTLEDDPYFTEAHVNLGNIYSMRGETDNALREYGAAIEINPREENAYYNLGIMYMKQKSYDKAAEAFRQTLSIDPDHLSARKNLENIPGGGKTEEYNSLGLLHIEKGEYALATEEFRKALELSPGYDELHNNLGIAYKGLGEFDGAEEEFRKTIELNPGHTGARNNLGSILYTRGRYADAVREFSEALRIDPGLASAHYNLGISYSKLREYNKALREFDYFLKLVPGNRNVENMADELRKKLR
jgi:protein O-mannosyl-transferase